MGRLRSWNVCRTCCSVFLAGGVCAHCAGIPDAVVEARGDDGVTAVGTVMLRPRVGIYAVGFGLGIVTALLVVIAG